ncbi:MAG: hypothetical protein ACK4TB_04985 [Gemmobacter sp.]
MQAVLVLAVAAWPAGAADLACAPDRMCRNAACAAAVDGGFRLTGHDGPNPVVVAQGERVAMRARVSAGAASVRFEGRNAQGLVELVIYDTGRGSFSHTRDAGRRNAPVWTGQCTVAQ